MWPNSEFPSDLVTFTEEILMVSINFCAVFYVIPSINTYLVTVFFMLKELCTGRLWRRNSTCLYTEKQTKITNETNIVSTGKSLVGYAVVNWNGSSLPGRRTCWFLYNEMRVSGFHIGPHWISEYPKIVCFILILKQFRRVKISISNIIIRQILSISTILENYKLGHAIKLLIWKKIDAVLF